MRSLKCIRLLLAQQLEASENAFEAVEQRSVLLADKKAIEEQLKPLELAIASYMGSRNPHLQGSPG